MYYYYTPGEEDAILFTGDTLFTGGAGKFFEGNGMDMYRVIQKLYKEVSDGTWVYPGHEYTLSNLDFGSFMEPDNEALKVMPQKDIWRLTDTRHDWNRSRNFDLKNFRRSLRHGHPNS